MAKDLAREIMKCVYNNDTWELKHLYSTINKNSNDVKMRIKTQIKRSIFSMVNFTYLDGLNLPIGFKHYKFQLDKEKILIAENERIFYYWNKDEEDLYKYIIEELDVKFIIRQNGLLTLDWSHWSH
jgi:hypothetical protein